MRRLIVGSVALASITAFVASAWVSAQQRDFVSRAATLRQQQAATHARAVYVWPYESGPFYGRKTRTEGGTALPRFRTMVGDFELTGTSLGIPEELTTPRQLDNSSARYFVAQVKPGADREISSAIERHGGAVLSRVPEDSLVARLTPQAIKSLEGSAGLLAIEPYHAAFKLHPAIGRTPLRDLVRAQSEIYALDVRLFAGEDAREFAERIASIGGKVTAIHPDTVVVELHASRLTALAQMQPVFLIFEHIPVYPQAEETTTTVQTGRYNNGATPYHDAGVDGGGGGIAATGPQVLMVLDTGIQLDAGDLSDTRVSVGTPGPAHRKVRLYTTVEPFGGMGDALGCDLAIGGGFTHGHAVAAVALGNATAVDPAQYGEAWTATDEEGEVWKLDGVAPGAVLVAYDAQMTPVVGGCGSPFDPTSPMTPGDLYSGGSSGALGDAFANHDARVFNLSFGNDANIYDADAMDVDQFLLDQPLAMVFVAAGNSGSDFSNDGVPDEGSVGSPATAKNAVAIGASRAANDFGEGGQEAERAYFSGVGPSPGNRIAPLLMAPGDEQAGGDSGLSSEFVCRTGDNASIDPVECDVITGLEGTSYSSAAASGAALLVRDYFAQGFYPDGTSSNPGNDADRVAEISGVLLKSVLIASAEFLTGDKPPVFTRASPGGDNLTREYRFNNEQGYGRIQLDNALPLQLWPASVSALLVADGAIDGGVNGLPGLDGSIDTTSAETDVATFSVCNTQDELRVVLTWTDPPTLDGSLLNDLDLELVSPAGKTYHGNYFTDDDDRDGDIVFQATIEDCPGIDGKSGTLSESPWSLPVCQRSDGTFSPHDTANLSEAVFLSPDPLGDGTVDQIEPGMWTVRVVGSSGVATAQRYAVAIAGGLCTESSAAWDRTAYSCNDRASARVFEVPQPGDLDPDEGDIAMRTTIQVLEGAAVVDQETGLVFGRSAASSLEFESAATPLTSGTARDPGNGVLDVRDGDTIRVIYSDVATDGTTPDPEKQRIAIAPVVCRPNIVAGGVVIEQFGRDLNFRMRGGCERNARNQFDFGFPDRYMDAGELLSVDYAFASYESVDLAGTQIDLRCVITDADSPADCMPHSIDCADPNRTNNPSCDQRPSGGPGDAQYMTILGTPQIVGLIPSQSAQSIRFGVEMAATIVGTPEVEMLLSIDGASAGKSDRAVTVTRHRLDVDEMSVFYSTDFPTGGVEFVDVNNDEVLEDPTTDPNDPELDYRFETRVWSDLTAGGTKNTLLQSPWDFDVTDGGFRSGILATVDLATIDETIAQWGEDLNFNGIDDKRCEDDPSIVCNRDTDCPTGICISLEDREQAGNGILDKSWNTRGGCGWQTRAPGSETGGIWHTGRIGGTVDSCLVVGDAPGQCQAYEVLGGTAGVRSWREALVTPAMQKVNGDDHQIEILDWAWNQAIELADSNVAWVWEFDTDSTKLEPVDLYSDNSVLNGLFGAYGAIGGSNNPDLTNGFSMFAPLDQNGDSWNGSLGNNRVGQNACNFEGNAVDLPFVCPNCPTETGDLGVARPLDDDVDNDNDGQIDEYVTSNGPIRNMDIFAVNGPDMRHDVLEDLYGETGEFFQASLGIWNFERTAIQAENKVHYGIGVDDMVVQWREFALAQDETSCAGGECAVVYLQTGTLFEPSEAVSIVVIDRSPAPVNDCDLDGMPDATVDCDGNGVPDVVVRVTSEHEPEGEIVILNNTANIPEFRGELPMSGSFDAPGILFVSIVRQETVFPSGFVLIGPPMNPTVTATYLDADDGTGSPCNNTVDPSQLGVVTDVATVIVREAGDIRLAWTEVLSDNGDHDGFADSNETVELRLGLLNQGDVDLSNVVAWVTTDDAKIDCVLQPTIYVGDLAAGEERVTDPAFVVRVADVDRTTAGLTDLDDFSVRFEVSFTSDQFDSTMGVHEFTLDLDLDAVGGGALTTYFEGFEDLSAGPYASFTEMNLDAGLHDPVAVDGYRCQYSDPDWYNSQAYAGGVTDCFLGANPEHVEAFYWQVHTPADVDGGKAYSGSNSLYMGLFGPGPDTHTTPVSVLEAIRTQEPIDLAAGMPAPILSFKQQIDFMDDRTVNVNQGDAPARAVVQLQMADEAGDPVGNWIKLYPYVNLYDTFGQDQYFACSFDPIDDGNDEDSYFDPTDPDRRLGPSSTCNPEKNFTYQGETFEPFDPLDAANPYSLGRAEGPGLEGSLGLGTWVEPRFDLSRFRGRRVRLRFLNTDLKAGQGTTWESLFQFNPSPGDDGWWIDDVEISNTLDQPALVVNDDKDNSQLPGCGNACNFVDARLAADPTAALAAPGQIVELSAVDSIADRCLGGILQFRFSADGDGDNQPGGAQDTVLRSWSESPMLIEAPQTTTTYIAEARCSADAACVDSAAVDVVVHCPTSGKLSFPTVLATDSTTLDWGESIAYDHASGALAGLPTYLTDDSGQNAGPSSTFDIAADNPAAGEGQWYLFREPGALGTGDTGFCNAAGIGWGNPPRDGSLP